LRAAGRQKVPTNGFTAAFAVVFLAHSLQLFCLRFLAPVSVVFIARTAVMRRRLLLLLLR